MNGSAKKREKAEHVAKLHILDFEEYPLCHGSGRLGRLDSLILMHCQVLYLDNKDIRTELHLLFFSIWRASTLGE